MKTKITLFLLLLGTVTVNTNAQLKHFLPNSNAVMSILDHKYWFEGDTIIESKRYTKVYRQRCTSEIDCGDLQYYAAVREDTIAEKIYAIYPCDSAMLPYTPYLCDEVLLADFNVQAGEQIEVCTNWPWLEKRLVTVEDVDSIWIDNQYRKRIKIKDEYDDFYHTFEWPRDSWVEGFGSVAYGLFFPSPEIIVDLGNPPAFLCMHLNGELLYRNPLLDVCFLPGWTSIPSIALSDSKIHYSTANSQLHIYGNYAYRIYNIQGSLVLSGNNSSAAINVSHWENGIYIVQLYDNKEFVYSGKFVKH